MVCAVRGAVIVYYLFTPHLPSPLSQAPQYNFLWIIKQRQRNQILKSVLSSCKYPHSAQNTHKQNAMWLANTHTQSAPAYTECKYATTTQTNNSALHHKAQICTSGCTRSCVLALIKSHSKMRAHTYSGKHQHTYQTKMHLQTNYAKAFHTHVLESNILFDVCETVLWRELSLCGLIAAVWGPRPYRRAYSQYATVLPSFCLFYTTGRPGSPWLSKAAQDKQN